MNTASTFRKLYIRTTNLTHSYQGKQSKLNGFYKLWSMCYDFSVTLDPAFRGGIKSMVAQTFKASDHTLDIGCGTDISSFHAAAVARQIRAIDPSADMLAKLKRNSQREISSISS